jgi:hypothetical protein
MPKKSLVSTSVIDTAVRAHNCKANRKHRIEKGEIRLKVKEGRNNLHYCKACALAIVSKDIEKLSSLLNELEE